MNIAKKLQPESTHIYKCEVASCPICGKPTKLANNTSGRKFVQTLKEVLRIGYRPGHCSDENCPGYQKKLRSSRWQQLAPLHCSYGFDVIARIGWLRQNENKDFERIHAELSQHIKISESEVRHLYYYRYLPLIACLQREEWEEVRRISEESGLILSLDGLAPEGGEPQLWVVRELKSGLPLRSGWMSEQSQDGFENFLRPIAEKAEEFGLKIKGIMSDKQRGLLPAIEKIFPGIPHSYCQAHYLNNLAESVSKADEEMKVRLRKKVREEVGELIRREETESRGVLMVTGLIPSPMESEKEDEKLPVRDKEGAKGESVEKAVLANGESEESEMKGHGEGRVLKKDVKVEMIEQGGGFDNKVEREEELSVANPEVDSSRMHQDCSPPGRGGTDKIGEEADKMREEIVEALLRRVRYLLTLKGRPPFRLAGLEMYERLKDLCLELGSFISHDGEPRLIKLQHGLNMALEVVADDYQSLRQGGDWLHGISNILDNEVTPALSGEQVKQKVLAYLLKMRKEARSPICVEFVEKMEKTTRNYEKGLFHTYDIEGLPRTNNILEGGFRDYKRGLLRTTGQVGATRRLMARSGAWEILGAPASLEDIVKGIGRVNQEEFIKERKRVRQQRGRFQLHTRSIKLVKKGMEKLKKLWQDIKPKEKFAYA